MDHLSRSRLMQKWSDLELPCSILHWLQSIDDESPKGCRYWDRAKRFVDYSSESDASADDARKAWRSILRHGIVNKSSDPVELAVFLRLLDEVSVNPYSMTYGGRRLDKDIVNIDRRRYVNFLDDVNRVRRLIGPPYDYLKNLLQDASADPTTLKIAAELRNKHLDGLKIGLSVLGELLSLIDPAKNINTQHWNSDLAAHAVFANHVAELNRLLVRPQHAALTRIALINCPSAKVTVDQVRAAWRNAAKQD